jgi:hypothetical protein
MPINTIGIITTVIGGLTLTTAWMSYFIRRLYNKGINTQKFIAAMDKQIAITADKVAGIRVREYA